MTQTTGGQVLLVFHGEEPVGFAVAVAALREGRSYLHSHMVRVLANYQGRGVGRALKLAQREDALARKIDLIEWTCDPLQRKNARFNVAHLGVIARHYIPNRTTSPLHGGLPTDRLLAEWWVRSARVEAVLHGRSPSPPPVTRRIRVPGDIRELYQTNPEQAEEIQSQFRARFEQLVAKGYAATSFEFQGDDGEYLLEPHEN